MEKFLKALVYAVKFVTDPKFQWEQAWVREVAGKCSVIHENIWTSNRFLGSAVVIWVSHKYQDPFLVLLILALFALADWVDGKVILAKGKIGTKKGSILDVLADRALILPIILYWGWWDKKFIFLPLFVLLAVIDLFSYVFLEILKRQGVIKDEGNFYEHLKIGKYKFGLQIILGVLLWLAFFFTPDWLWWPIIINVLLGIIIILAGFAVACKIDYSFIRFLADFFTIGNAVCGILAIYWASRNIFFSAAFIMIGSGFDLVDGFIAEKTKKVASPSGIYLDSLADLITFGIAPAWLVWQIGGLGFVALTYFITTLARLAVYIQSKKETVRAKRSRFSGFPSTACGVIIASLAMSDFSAEIIGLALSICAFLEVAFMLEWYHFKNIFSLPISIQAELAGLLLFFIIIKRGGLGMLVIILLYAVFFYRPIADRLIWKT